MNLEVRNVLLLAASHQLYLVYLETISAFSVDVYE